MIDIKLLREHPDLVRAGVAKKKFAVDVDHILELDARRRELIGAFESARAEQNEANKDMAAVKDKKSPEFQEKVKAMREVAARVKDLQAQQDEAEAAFKTAFLTLPNVPHESVPVGRSDEDNVEMYTWGDFSGTAYPHALPHYDIPWFSKAVELERGVKVTGAGFPFFLGDMARLVRALTQFLLDEAADAGYVEMACPLLVNADSATATGQLPDKEGQMYHAQTDDLYLIPTSEVPVTNFYRNEVLAEDALPIYHTAYTPCFRREAGSYGKDVRGLNRVHQFDKVEMVKWVHPDTSFDELEKLTENAASLLKKLDLPFRQLSVCSGDIGLPHAKQYDLEVWAAGQKRWLEVSSCSNFTDYQARRANIRFKAKDGGKPQFVHTLNGSGLGMARVVAAILENYLQEDQSLAVPEVLKARVGKERLVF